MKGLGDMGGLLKQAQKIQQDMMRAQEELVNIEVEASVGGGMVSVKANARQEILAVSINPDAVDKDDVEMLEDLVLSAVNEALRQAAEAASDHMGSITSPLKGMIPPGMNLPGL